MCDALALVGGFVVFLLVSFVALCLAFLARELAFSGRFLYRIYRAYGTAVIKSPLRFVWYDAWSSSEHLTLWTSKARTQRGPRVYRRGAAYQTHDLPEEGVG